MYQSCDTVKNIEIKNVINFRKWFKNNKRICITTFSININGSDETEISI